MMDQIREYIEETLGNSSRVFCGWVAFRLDGI